jgi:hypothetical protein
VLAKLDALTASLERLEATQHGDTAELRAKLANIEAVLARDGK